MTSSFRRGRLFLVVLALAALALRPHAGAEAVLDVLLAPTRVLGELARPVGWLDRREARAAEEHLAAQRDRELAWSRRLKQDERRFALPSDPALRAGRAFVHGTVVGRAHDNLDEIRVRVAGGDAAGIEPGMPVVSGDVFVGRVRAVDDPVPGVLRVDLVTGRRFNVGARVEGGDRAEGVLLSQRESAPAARPTWIVSGGLVAAGRGQDDLRLSVRTPSRSAAELVGLARVNEDLAHLEHHGGDARGFRLGWITHEEDRPGIRPELDYEGGLNRVAVVLSADAARPGGEDPDVFADGGWLPVHRLSFGDPSPWRVGLKIGAGRLAGLGEGAAVVHGTRLVGRVARTGLLTADVRTLADPGLAVPAQARVDGQERPLALGRLVAEGRDPRDGRLVLRWPAVVPLAGTPAGELAAAELFTAAGEAGVPAGIYLGRALLPSGPGPHRIWLEEAAPSARVRRLWVRCAPRTERSGP